MRRVDSSLASFCFIWETGKEIEPVFSWNSSKVNIESTGTTISFDYYYFTRNIFFICVFRYKERFNEFNKDSIGDTGIFWPSSMCWKFTLWMAFFRRRKIKFSFDMRNLFKRKCSFSEGQSASDCITIYGGNISHTKVTSTIIKTLTDNLFAG